MKVTIDAETARQYKLYAATVPQAMALPAKGRVGKVIRYALRDWMAGVGRSHVADASGAEDENTGAYTRMDWMGNVGQLARQEAEKVEPMPKDFSAEDQFRARGLGIRLD